MRNRDLAADHLRRAGARLRALDVLFESGSWADVVRESQEVVELTLKGLLRDCELAFYGAEDLTPSSFYRESDAVIARDSARDVVAVVRPHVGDK
ncbi:MAG: HEPN domain-containing protein [Vicinamibacterales bacterium]